MPIYKISYVIIGNGHPGMIINQDHLPQKGQRIQIEKHTYEIIEVVELLPPRGEFHYIHVTCRPAR